ncbi:hypothetical protein BOX15_Mlig014555g3, partial [Macrostomum lignano]
TRYFLAQRAVRRQLARLARPRPGMPCSPAAKQQRSGAIAPSRSGQKQQKQQRQSRQKQPLQKRHRLSSRRGCEICPMLGEIDLVRRVIDSRTTAHEMTPRISAASIGRRQRSATGVSATGAPSGFWLRERPVSQQQPAKSANNQVVISPAKQPAKMAQRPSNDKAGLDTKQPPTKQLGGIISVSKRNWKQAEPAAAGSSSGKSAGKSGVAQD